MREYELEVLDQYGMEVKSTRRIRGAFFCETSEGTMLLKETRISEKRAALLYLILNRLETECGVRVDTPVFTKNGQLLAASKDGAKFMLKKWFSGHECDMKKEHEIIEAAKTLALLHNKLVWREDGQQESSVAAAPFPKKSPLEEMERHNREMKKVRSFIRARVSKNEFEHLYLENFDRMYTLAAQVVRKMEVSGCAALYEKSVESGRMIHGDYNYHNILFGPEGIAVTNFERTRMDIQVQDLYYFVRKVMEKYHWKQKLGRDILEAYESVREMEETEREYIGLCLAYPEKFWKTASSYAHSNKAWLPEKSVEKLLLAVKQTDEKAVFLEDVFSLDLSGSDIG